RRLTSLARGLAMIVPFIVLAVFALGWWRGLHFEELFVFGVSLVVSVVPEGLSLGVTIALAVAAWRMAHQGALLRNLASAETLGSATVLAVDKTGTLTQNKLEVARLYCLGGQMVRSASGSGWEVTANVSHAEDQQVVREQSQRMALIGA